MNLGVIIAIVGAAAWIPGVYGIIEAVRRHKQSVRSAIDKGDRLVVQSAIELLAPYKSEVAELKTNLHNARDTIDDLKDKLDAATRRANDLNEQLLDAQSELGFLRIQVKSLSQQIKQAEQ